MKLIIDIPENVIEGAKSSPNYYPTYHFEKIWRAIANGIPYEPKGDLISREALKKYARVVFDKDLGRLRVVDVSDIDNAPTVDMNTELSVAYLKGRRQGQADERPQGKWIGKEEYDDYPNKTVCECSECGKMICVLHNDFPNLCENCGAKMKGGAE